MGMGFTRDMILKAVKDNGNGDEGSLLDLLLTYKPISNDPTADNRSTSVHVPNAVDEDDDDILENWDDENIGGSRGWSPSSDDSDCEDFLQGLSQEDEKVGSLVGMGFSKAMARMAVIRCDMLLIWVAAIFLLAIDKFPSLSTERQFCPILILVTTWYYIKYFHLGPTSLCFFASGHTTSICGFD